jgi:hypothetical protein
LPDIGLRNLGAIIPGTKGTVPAPTLNPALAPALARTAQKSRAAGQTPDTEEQSAGIETPVFAADVSDDATALISNALGLDAPLGLLAELASHRRTQTPLTIGLLGPSGCGKSIALNKLARSIENLNAAARNAAASPFLAKILILRIDAVNLEGPPANALAAALYARLAADAPSLAVEASQSARDPRVAAREAFERLDAARHKLESERRSIEEAEGRRARLADVILYETPGSQIDAYAAGRRGPIAAIMTRFGVGGDPVLGYKDMVRTVAESQGASRAGFALQAFWGLKGQAKLIVTAIALLLLGVGLGAALDHQATWLAWLRGQPQMASAAAWIEARAGWLSILRGAAFLGAAFAFLVNVWRGSRLLRIVFRGASLLKAELASRRRESDGHFGHQARRAQDFAAEVDRLSAQAAEAERRAGGLQTANPALADPSPFAADILKQQAQRFVTAVGSIVQRRIGANASANVKGAAPQRIIVAIDNLDMVSVSRAREILTHARCLLGQGYASLIALNPARLTTGPDADALRLDKWIGAPFQVGEACAGRDCAAQIRDLLGSGAGSDAGTKAPVAVVDATRSALDEPLTESETALLAALAPLAGNSARAVKHFVNLYRLLRAQWADSPEERGALALMLALDAGGSPEDLAIVNAALALSPTGEIVFDHHKIGPRLASALLALSAAQARLTSDALRRADAAARLFSFGPPSGGATETR